MIIAFIATLVLTSCTINGMDSIAPKGEVLIKNITLTSNFNKIKVSNGINVILTQNNESKVSVEANENLFDYIQIDVEDETLIIKKNKNFTYSCTQNVYVSMPVIEKIKASSASNITATNLIKSKKLTIDASSAASLELEVVAENLNLDFSSASQITLKGKVIELEIETSSAAEVNAESLICKNASVKASSASSIKVNAINNLISKASSGATILYSQSPNNLTINESSGGNIKLN